MTQIFKKLSLEYLRVYSFMRGCTSVELDHIMHNDAYINLIW